MTFVIGYQRGAGECADIDCTFRIAERDYSISSDTRRRASSASLSAAYRVCSPQRFSTKRRDASRRVQAECSRLAPRMEIPAA